MPKFVIDTNIWVMALTSRSRYHPIYLALVAGKYEMAVSHDILLEYEEIIAKKYGSGTAAGFLELLQILPNVHFIRSYFNWRLITADGDDDKYVDIAITSGSDALVSEDRHFDVLDQIPFPKLTILRIEEFLSLLSVF